MAQTQQGQNAINAPKGATDNAFNLGAPVGKYASLGDLANNLAPDVRKDLVKTFGNQGISGLLELMGATKSVASADEVTYFEETRLHPSQAFTSGDAIAAGASQDFVAGVADAAGASSVDQLNLRKGDLVLDSAGKVAIVTSTTVADGAFTIKSLDAGDLAAVGAAATGTFPIVGNMYAQGTDQPARFIESNIVKRTNPFAIVKESYQVSGSAATNIGYIDVGGGDYRWYIKGEMDARQRFLDARELTMLLGEKTSVPTGISGTEGYFAAVRDRGITGAAADLNTLAELDTTIALLDKQGAPVEYAAMLNSELFAAFNGFVAGEADNAAYGTFNNDSTAAVNLGFQSFARGGYTFHMKKMGLLNSPNLMGNANGAAVAKGCLIPLANVVDPKTGNKAPALELNYKAANGYNREMDHWVTGGGVLGFTNDTTDIAKFHYRSECCLVTRAANQHVLIK
jgi:hypothetical protein|tara:strand:- start:886 stop:2253 length:1368 start_codon:yes stop_codon:yes gene_type:complete